MENLTTEMYDDEHPSLKFVLTKGEFGKNLYKEYKSLVEKNFDNHRILNVLKFYGDVIKGSNPFSIALFNQIIPEELKVAGPKDLEKMIRWDFYSIRGLHNDSGIVLRDNSEPNSYLANKLKMDIYEQKILELPVMIPLSELRLIKDDKAPYGLALKLKENAEIYSIPILSQEGFFKSEEIDEESGLPKILYESKNEIFDRKLFSLDNKHGLTRLYLDPYNDIQTHYPDLNDSYLAGRVLLVKR
ncbi:MAG: hypothetical protein WC867_01850 [Candidatus Pacearchaeota archaeon]|jgi:hypothetical protein